MVTESSIAYSYRYIVSEGERDAERLKLMRWAYPPAPTVVDDVDAVLRAVCIIHRHGDHRKHLARQVS